MNVTQTQSSTTLAIRPRRTLVLCFDGTGNSFDDENTNIVRLFSALDKTRPDKQLCYYQPGIGTYVGSTSSWSPWKQKIAEILDEGLAWDLDAHVGLLPKNNEEQVSFAYKKYTDLTKGQEIRASGFKAAFSREIDIDFVGVWDTVASVGVLSKHLPFTSSNHIIKTFRHAMALDEHRAKFKPNPWHRTAPTAEATTKDPESGTAVAIKPLRPNALRALEEAVEHSFHGNKKLQDIKKKEILSASEDQDGVDVDADVEPGRMPTDVREVWFAGCHADVGGGSVENNTKNTLANPSLKWMINEILNPAYNLGIYFKPNAFEEIQAFDTLITTTRDSTPRPRKGIPSVFLKAPNKILNDNNNNASTLNGGGHVQNPSDTPTLVDISSSPPRTAGPSIGSGTALDKFDPISPIVTHDTSKPDPSNDVDTDMEGMSIVKVVENSPDVDANAPMYDQLQGHIFWWILEYAFLPQSWQDRHGVWQRRWT
ncbi:hypothetical protein FRB96_006429 [Tulasnella sp. 330]|nr:hypothetical protein FRB96_006429 [Tulasnella sp. 330]